MVLVLWYGLSHSNESFPCWLEILQLSGLTGSPNYCGEGPDGRIFKQGNSSPSRGPYIACLYFMIPAKETHRNYMRLTLAHNSPYRNNEFFSNNSFEYMLIF